MSDEGQQPNTQKLNSTATVSGGVNLVSQEDAFIGGDVVGRDKIVNITQSLTDRQMDNLAERIAEKVRIIQQEIDYESANALYRPSDLSARVVYIYATRHDIANKIRHVVLKHGAWAGSSMADFSVFFDLAQSHALIAQELAQDIGQLYHFTQFLLNANHVSSDEQFLEVQYLAMGINMQLDRTIANK